jgi:hypothetical protein
MKFLEFLGYIFIFFGSFRIGFNLFTNSNEAILYIGYGCVYLVVGLLSIIFSENIELKNELKKFKGE